MTIYLNSLSHLLPLSQRIPSKGPRAFDLFLECLRDTEDAPHLELEASLRSKLEELTNS